MADARTPRHRRKPGTGRRVEPYAYGGLLGIRQQSPLALARRVREGLAFATFDRFQRNTGLSAQVLASVVDIKLRTLHRRKAEGRLQPEESDRLLRFSGVFGKALDLFEGNVATTRAWLSSPARALGGERPIVLAKTDLGAREVEALIGRLEHGVVS